MAETTLVVAVLLLVITAPDLQVHLWVMPHTRIGLHTLHHHVFFLLSKVGPTHGITDTYISSSIDLIVQLINHTRPNNNQHIWLKQTRWTPQLLEKVCTRLLG